MPWLDRRFLCPRVCGYSGFGMAEPNQLARVSGQSGGQISVTSCRNGLVVTQFLVRAFLRIRRVTRDPAPSGGNRVSKRSRVSVPDYPVPCPRVAGCEANHPAGYPRVCDSRSRGYEVTGNRVPLRRVTKRSRVSAGSRVSI
jgi:hypothetical protein